MLLRASSVLIFAQVSLVIYFSFRSTCTFALQTQQSHRVHHSTVKRTNYHDSTAPPSISKTPGALRRRLFGEPPKISVPLPLISALVAALKGKNLFQAIPFFFQELTKEQTKNTALPVAYMPCSDLSFCEDCLSAQRHVRLANSSPPPFLLELTPSMCDIDPHNDDRQSQLQWLQTNAERLRDWKIEHGAVYFKSWSLFTDAEGVSQAWNALGMTPCRDPKEIRGPAPLLHGSSTIYETLNNPQDAATHLGLHFEGIPGIMPTSALFSCFQPAESGGEFMLCDGRGVFRDLNADTLEHLQTKKLRPTFAEIPDWIATSPLPLATDLQREILALFTDMTKPTDDFFLDVFPGNSNAKESLKLTTHPSIPVLNHPVTGEPVWFSGMDAGHQGNFQKDNPHLSSRGGKYASEVFDVRYGDDGTEISETDLANVRQACQQNTRALIMKPGDAVFLDNFTTLHGRKPFVGTRKHTVVWFLD